MNPESDDTAKAHFIRDQLPPGGLFANQNWRISPAPFVLEPKIARPIEKLGRLLLQFYRSLDLLYRLSSSGKQPAWIAEWLNRGKPQHLIDAALAAKQELPRVLRPDILITEEGLAITELDSVPGGIGLTAWLHHAYTSGDSPTPNLLGGARGMIDGFQSIFPKEAPVEIVISDEAASYRPEMEWLAKQLGDRFSVRDGNHQDFQQGSAVYRFFELFDLRNIPNSARLLELLAEGKITLTSPPKPHLEEKSAFALLWNWNLRGFWKQELGESFFTQLQSMVPYTWLIDNVPLPPHGAVPRLEITDWQQLKGFSQRERDLILKVSGFSEEAWGSRGVYYGSDLSQSEWSDAVDRALANAATQPYILQRYHKPKTVGAAWYDFDENKMVPMEARVRLCPYYFVTGEREGARANLGGVLATLCPADKKIIHGMTDAILAPCCT